MKKTIIQIILFVFALILPCNAETIWVDDSVNELIIKQYDANALREEHMPELPESLKLEKKTEKASAPAIQEQQVVQNKPINKPVNTDNYVQIKKGKKFRLRIEQPIDDSSYVGAKIVFTSLYPESNKYITIPAGTKFIGVVEDAHMPQLSSNGGLLVIKINKILYNGRYYPIEAKVIKVGDKRIFQNNIKGKHTYWKNMAKAVKPGKKFYDKTWKITKNFAKDGLEVILTPVTFVSGATVFAVSTVASPFVALFSKGERLFINKGTRFQIKLLEDVAIYL